MKKKPDTETGLISEGKLNEVLIQKTRRSNGTIREQTDYSFCPTLTEQHTAHLSDLNYLVAKYKPDELAAYIAAKAQHRREILGLDFSQEPSLQEAKNHIYSIKQSFEALPDTIKNNFRNHVEFLKFIDNPANQQKMLSLGLLTKKQISSVTSDPKPQTRSEELSPPSSPPK